MSDEFRVHRKRDGNLVIGPDGRATFLSIWESIWWRLTGRLPKRITDQLNRKN